MRNNNNNGLNCPRVKIKYNHGSINCNVAHIELMNYIVLKRVYTYRISFKTYYQYETLKETKNSL
jgi:hypothetical protein